MTIGEESQHNGTNNLTSRRIDQIIKATCTRKSTSKRSHAVNGQASTHIA
jgi:hypothetical protein